MSLSSCRWPDQTMNSMCRLKNSMWRVFLHEAPGPVREVRVITPSLFDMELARRLAWVSLQWLSALDNTLPRCAHDRDSYRIEIDSRRLHLPNEGQIWELKDVSRKEHVALVHKGFSVKRRVLDYVGFYTPEAMIRTIKIWEITASRFWRGLIRTPIRVADDGSTIFSDFAVARSIDTNHILRGRPVSTLSERERSCLCAGLLENGCFRDQFTEIAAAAFQQAEGRFESESDITAGGDRANPIGSYKFVLVEDQLRLIPFHYRGQEAGEREAIELYRHFLKCVYGASGMYFLKKDYAIEVEGDGPLLPEHIFKANIAANVTTHHFAHNLLQKLRRIFSDVPEMAESGSSSAAGADASPTPIGSFYDFYSRFSQTRYMAELSIRSVKGLYDYMIARPSLRDAGSQIIVRLIRSLLNLDEGAPPPDNLKYLSPLGFDQLMSVYMNGFDLSPQASDQPAFTGRTIRHLAIAGYKTMGDPKLQDHCRSHFETLHIFSSLQTTKGGATATWADPSAFYELLSHVISKKNIWRWDIVNPKILQLSEGYARILPGPWLPGESAATSVRTWYQVSSFIDDRGGDTNFVLTPVVDKYRFEERRLPVIKLFRSTAGSPEADSSSVSVAADLNPEGVESLCPVIADYHALPTLYKSTMPIWLAMLWAGSHELAAQRFQPLGSVQDQVERPELHKQYLKLRATSESYQEERILEFLASSPILKDRMRLSEDQDEAIRQVRISLWDPFQSALCVRFPEQTGRDRNSPAFREFFLTGLFKDEWTLDYEKQPHLPGRDIVILGHSLGGALAQNTLVRWLTKYHRVPMPMHRYALYGYDCPGAKKEKGSAFSDAQLFSAIVRTYFGSLRDAGLISSELERLAPRWSLSYMFEKDSNVPEAGYHYLGADGSPESPFYTFSATVISPIEQTAVHPEITTLPVHGRRMGHAQENRDYIQDPIPPTRLYLLKSGWGLPFSESRRIMSQFGYVTVAPRILEAGRSLYGRVRASKLLEQQREADRRRHPLGDEEARLSGLPVALLGMMAIPGADGSSSSGTSGDEELPFPTERERVL